MKLTKFYVDEFNSTIYVDLNEVICFDLMKDKFFIIMKNNKSYRIDGVENVKKIKNIIENNNEEA